MMDFSLIVPSYNEAGNIRSFYQSVVRTFSSVSLTYEIIFIDDGSSDETLPEIKSIIAECQASTSATGFAVTVVSFTRNFGKEAAMLAGLKRAQGSYVGFIDADMQQDPATSLAMLQFLQSHAEFDCVAAVQERRREGMVLRGFKRAFYRIFNAVGDIDIPAGASDFRVFRREVAHALIQMPEYYRFSKGLFAWAGFKTHLMSYMPLERAEGNTTWSRRKLFSYAINGIMSFTTWPLRLTTYLGLLTSAGAIFYLLCVLYEKAFLGVDIPGYPTLVCLILLFNGILMLVLGVFGEYLARIYMEGKHRPIYLARETASTGFPGASHEVVAENEECLISWESDDLTERDLATVGGFREHAGR